MSVKAYAGTRPTRFPLKPVTVYTFFDSDDKALYVGCTSRQYVRFAGHGSKPWWTDVARIEVEHFEAEEDGRRHERHLIRKLRPAHNIAEHPDRDPQLLRLRQRSPYFDALCTKDGA